jgi:hypothetical protein
MILVRLRIPFFFLFFPPIIYLFACNSMYVDNGNITRPSTLVKITTTKKKKISYVTMPTKIGYSCSCYKEDLKLASLFEIKVSFRD